MPQAQMDDIINKMEDELNPEQHIPTRPTRQAAVKAALLRKEMLKQNIL